MPRRNRITRIQVLGPTRSSKPHPRAPPPDPRLKPRPVFVASGGVKTRMFATEICGCGEVWKVMRNAPITSDVRSHLGVCICRKVVGFLCVAAIGLLLF